MAEARQVSSPQWSYALDSCSDEATDSLSWPQIVEPGDTDGLIRYLRGRGFLTARVTQTLERDGRASIVCVAAGTRYRVQPTISVEGSRDDGEHPEVEPAALDSLAQAELERLEAAGRIRSVIVVDSFQVDADRIGLDMNVLPGRQARLLGLLVGGRTRTSVSYLERVTGLREGRLLEAFDSARIRRELQATGLFHRVEEPLLLPTSDSTAIVQLMVEDRAPGSFDLALGYLPGGAGRSGSIVGSGNLVLRNLFGGGRSLSVELDRLPGQTSSLDASVADPFVLGRDVGAELSFAGYQQDSTFSRQEYRASTSLRLGVTVLRATASRRVSRPGTAGAAIVNGRQLVADASTRMAGFGIIYRLIDDRQTPSRGIELDVEVLRGRQQRDALEVTGSDTLRVGRGILQDRLQGSLRGYLPVSNALTLVLGGDARVLVTDDPDPSDLYRLGGASSLRGYDEERFAGIAVGRALIELRSQLQGPSFAYLFADVGYVDPGRGPDEKPGVHPGFGVGVRLMTAAGLLNVSYAVNREDGLTNGRVHFGIAFGL